MTRWQRFLHLTMGWHRPIVVTGFDGCSQRARCGTCGYVGLIDSTGALF